MTLKVPNWPHINQPDPAAVFAEECLEHSGRLDRLVVELKARACRGDEQAEAVLMGIRNALYDLWAESLMDMKQRPENEQ